MFVWFWLFSTSALALWPIYFNCILDLCVVLWLTVVVRCRLRLPLSGRWCEAELAVGFSGRVSNVTVFIRRILFIPWFSGWRKSKCVFLVSWWLLNFAFVLDTPCLVALGTEWRRCIGESRRLKKLTSEFCSHHLLGVGIYIAGAPLRPC